MKTIKNFILTPVILGSVLINTSAHHKTATNNEIRSNEGAHKTMSLVNKKSRNYFITNNYFIEINTFCHEKTGNLKMLVSSAKRTVKKLELSVAGTIIKSQTADLNYNGFPEILIHTRSADTEAYGSVICFSINTDSEIVKISLPDIYRNADACKGYRGHDTFTIENNTLVRKFPVYNVNDAGNNPAGNTRIIKYALVGSGEKLRFVISEISK